MCGEDRSLAERAAEGDFGAFTALYERHYQRIFRTSFKLLKNFDDAEDVTQETFLQAWRKIGQFQGKAQFSTWLTRIAINNVLMHRRKRANYICQNASPLEGSSDHDRIAPLLYDEGPSPEDEAITHETHDILREAIDGLPPGQRMVVTLLDLQERSYGEAAIIMDRSLTTIKAQRSRGHRSLQLKLVSA